MTTTAGDFTISGTLANSGLSSSSGTAFVRTNGVTSTTLADAITNGPFFGFTFDPVASSATLNSLTYDYLTTTNGPAINDFTVSVLSDVTGFTDANVLDTVTLNAAGTASQIVDLSAFSGFASLDSPVEFRFYFDDDSASASQPIHRIDNVILTSDVIVPPTEWLTDADGDWNTGTNWSSNPEVPGTAGLVDANVLFGSAISAARTVTLNTSASLNSIAFNSGTNYTVADDASNPGVNAITLTGDAEVGASAGRHVINAKLAGTAGLTKTGGGDLVLGGDNTFTGTTDVQEGLLRVTSIDSINDTVNVASTFVFQGDADAPGTGFQGTFTPDITGDGLVVVSNSLLTEEITFDSAKSFAGQIRVSGGNLVVAHSDALGTGGTVASRTRVNHGTDGAPDNIGGTVKLTGGVTVASEILAPLARTTDVAHLSNSGNNAWNGNVVGDGTGQFNIESTTGTLTLGGLLAAPDADANERTYVFSGAGDFNITGNITDDLVEP